MQRILEGTEKMYWTKKRAEIVTLLKKGVSYDEICTKLHTTMPTVLWVVQNLKDPPLPPQSGGVSTIKELVEKYRLEGESTIFRFTVSFKRELDRATSRVDTTVENIKRLEEEVAQVRIQGNQNSQAIKKLEELGAKTLKTVENIRPVENRQDTNPIIDMIKKYATKLDQPVNQIELETMRLSHEKQLKQLDLEMARANHDLQFRLAEFNANREDKKREQEEKQKSRTAIIEAVGDVTAAFATGMAAKPEAVKPVRPERSILFGLHIRW